MAIILEAAYTYIADEGTDLATPTKLAKEQIYRRHRSSGQK